MRKATIFALFIALCMTVTAQRPKKEHAYLPGNGHLDMEQFIHGIDTNMDISQLSLAELRVLKNGFAARQGFVFKDADLRSIYYSTSWYDSLVWERYDAYENEEQKDEGLNQFYFNGYDGYYQNVKLTPAERKFIEKIGEREQELYWKLRTKDGYMFNTDLIINPYQLTDFDPRLKEALGRQGFAIVPNNKLQLFHIYEKNDYSDFPSFITTDLYLQLFHFYFDSILRDIEEHRMDSLLRQFCQEVYVGMDGKDTFNEVLFAVAWSTLTGETPDLGDAKLNAVLADETEKINHSEDTYSDFLGYTNVKFGYSLFRPRGHYTRNEKLQRYFRTMMWLQTVPFGTDKAQQLKSATLLAGFIDNNDKAKRLYTQLFEPMTFLFGEPDNVTIMQLADEIRRTGMSADKLVKDKKAMAALRSKMEELGDRQIRIRPKFENTSHTKINVMPQRYQPDAEVLNEMIDAKSRPTLRAVPRGLDVFAAMGSNAAERILIDELEENKQWGGYQSMLDSMKRRMTDIDWTTTVSNRWLESLSSMQDTLDNYPAFMKTPQWAKKNLNTALASWAELKHDAILYAKQPMGAECGAGGPPDPILKSYVEPNVAFWQKAVALNYALEEVLERYGLMTEKAITTGTRIKEVAEFLLNISRKELGCRAISDVEYQEMEIIGSQFENISLDLAREPEQWLMGWDDVQGPDKSIACVADVYTANAENNPNPSILYAATGPAYEIYVLVEMDGTFYLTRGAVLSYREFQRPIHEQRLNDEEWQQNLKQHPTTGTPEWMKEIVVPLEQAPEDNEEMFYSSGC